MLLPATTIYNFLFERPRRGAMGGRMPERSAARMRRSPCRQVHVQRMCIERQTAVDRYRQLLADIGDLFTHAKDVSDLPQLLLIGFVLMGLGAVGVAVLLERCLSWLKDDSRSRGQN
jgi:hypothetical protein